MDSLPDDDVAPLDVPGLIRRVRRVADLSQRELAQRVGVSQSALARWETGCGAPAADVFARLLAVGGFRLTVVDSGGAEARPMASDTPRDGQRRVFPAHLDIVDDVEPYTGAPQLRSPRRDLRDLRRRWNGEVPPDHPTLDELAQSRARRREAARARVASARDAARARRSAQR